MAAAKEMSADPIYYMSDFGHLPALKKKKPNVPVSVSLECGMDINGVCFFYVRVNMCEKNKTRLHPWNGAGEHCINDRHKMCLHHLHSKKRGGVWVASVVCVCFIMV